MHQKDRIQKLYSNGAPILDGGITFEEHIEGKNRDYLLGSTIIIIHRHSGNNLEILCQQRASRMMTEPNKWDMHGGYINYGETPLEAIMREAKEEIGINLNSEKIEFGFTIEQHDAEISTYYFYDFTGENQEFSFNDKEVQALKWVSFDDFKNNPEKVGIKESLLNNKEFFALSTKILEKHGNLDK